MNVDEEIKSLRTFRHDLEGRGIMGLPERVVELEKARHNRELENVRLETTIHTLTLGFGKLQKAIEGFHEDVRETRNSFTAEIGSIRKYVLVLLVTVALANLIPSDILNNLLLTMLKLF